MYDILWLSELTTSQLEAALVVGEGLTKDVEILEVGQHDVLQATLVMDKEGVVRSMPTKVKYRVVLKDEMEESGELDAVIFVKVTSGGIEAKF